MENKVTLEYFGIIFPESFSYYASNAITLGATTFRLRASGLTIFHDTWLDRPSLMQEYLNTNDVTDADYILISHAHFDQYVYLEKGYMDRDC